MHTSWKARELLNCHLMIDGDSKSKMVFHYVRFLILAVITLGSCVVYLTRTNINVTIVGMVRDNDDNKTQTINCTICNNGTKSAQGYPLYDWDEEQQGMILGSFFYTYLLFQVPLGTLVEKYGGKWIIALCFIGAAMINAITPWAATNYYSMIASRAAFGMISAGVFPGFFGVLVDWMPIDNRAFALSMLDVGTTIGTIITDAMAGILSDTYGWPSVFYVSSGIAVFAFIVHTALVKSKPQDHPMISSKELERIQESSQMLIKDDQLENNNEGRPPKPMPKGTPWLKMMTTPAVLASLGLNVLITWTYYVKATKYPAYFKNVLKMDLTNNGIWNSLISLTGLTCPFFAILSERIIQKKYLSRTNTRKLFVFIHGLGSGLCCLMIPLFGNGNISITMTFVFLSDIFSCVGAGGNAPILAEMTKNYPATLYAVLNALSNGGGFAAPYVAGLILKSYGIHDLTGWRIIFFMACGFNMFGTIIFVLFASAERQSFDFI